MKLIITAALALNLAFFLLPSAVRADDLPPFVYGADLSELKTIEDHGVKYRDAGAPKDAMLIFKEHGWNFVRFRLFLYPDGKGGQVNTLPYTLELAKRAKAAGLQVLLDLHYSDGWADPGHQVMPAAWQGLSHADLVDKVFTYTRDTIAAFRDAGCVPDMVEVGNEVTNGFIWPDGGPMTDAKWGDFTDLLKAGIRGVHDNDASSPIKIMIHIDRGADAKVSKWFFDHLTEHHVSFDVIGLSLYPFGGATLSGLQENLGNLAHAYGKDIMVAETSYNWQNGGQNKLSYPYSPEGQKAYLAALAQIVAATPGGHGRGVFYWAAGWIDADKWNGPGRGGEWDDRALFDESGNALPAMDAFRP